MERNHCATDGTMTPEYVTYLEGRAAGGAALMFTEAAYARLDGKGRVRQMGVDVLSVHGYLIHQFLSPATNHRSDEFRRPTLFLDLVLEAVRRAVPDLALGIRLSALEGTPRRPGRRADPRTDPFGSPGPARLHRRVGGQLRGRTVDGAAGGVAAGCARAVRRSLPRPGSSRRRGRADQHAAEEILAEGRADFVSLARALHADPDWPNRAFAGRRYRPCIACNLCVDRLHTGERVPCTVNADLGAVGASRTTAGARILVVGAGPAGLETARRLAVQGHRAELVE